MATAEQKIFKKIVLHNNLLKEETLDRLLAQLPDPEKAVKFLVKREKLTVKKAGQLLTMYHKQLQKQLGNGGESQVLTEGKTDRPMSADESFEAMFDEIVSGTPKQPADAAEQPSAESSVAASVETASVDLEESAAPVAESPQAAAPSGDQAEDRLVVDVEEEVEPEASVTQSDAPPAAPQVEEDELPVLELDTDLEEEPAPEEPEPEPEEPAVEQPAPKAVAAIERQQPEAPQQPPAAAAAPKQAAPKVAAAPVASQPAGPIDPLAKEILLAARSANASDAHIKSGEIPVLRVAGRLSEIEGMQPIPAERCEKALLSLLNGQRRQLFLETNDLDFCYDGGEELGRFRSNFMRQHRGMDGIFRLISSQVPSFEELKLPPLVKKFTEYKQGIVLVTGPKGSGKTTTLAAMVDLINSTRAEHIITVEDPIEFVHPCKKGHVNQREVGPHTKTFSAALRAALREAPDVIMVGEMRDLETTSLAITAAETGHLVFATLHTPDALRTIDRILDVFPPKEQGQIRSMIAESMRGIISQLLIPSVDGKSQELAVEILVNTVAIGNLIREAKTFQLRGVMQTGRKLGMQLMDDALVELAKANKVSKEDVLAVATERNRVESELSN